MWRLWQECEGDLGEKHVDEKIKCGEVMQPEGL